MPKNIPNKKKETFLVIKGNKTKIKRDINTTLNQKK